MSRRSASALLALLLAGTSCGKKAEKKAEAPPAPIDAAARGFPAPSVVVPQTMVLRQVLLETNDPTKAYDLDSERLAKRLGASLVTSGWVAARDSEVPDDHQARRVEALLNVSYDVTLPSADTTGTLVVAIEAILEFIDERGALQPRVALIVEQGLTVSGDAEVSTELNRLAQAALESVAESLVARERLRRAPHEELLSVLSVGSEEVSTKIWALQLAADRGLREAVPAGMKALAHEDPEVRAAAISALVSLGDPRAVSALSKDVDFKDYEELRVIMEAVSAIGGSDAVEFLEYVATGHPDDDIRDRAKENVEQARRKIVPK
jgi:hypothetical protein